MIDIIINYIETWAQLIPVYYLPAIGGLLSERSGVANLCLEGKILTGAFGAIIGTALTGSIWGGLFFASLFSLIMAAFHAFLCLNVKINAFVSGIIINQLAFSGTGVLVAVFFNSQRPTVDNVIPTFIVGKVNISPLFVFTILILLIAVYLFKYTYIKTWLISCGESSTAALRSGIPVLKIRYLVVILSGILCGIAGSHLSIGIMNQFSRGMSANHGFLAIGAIIIGSWKPLPTFFACAIMSAVEVAQIELQIFPSLPYQVGFILSYVIIFGAMILRKGKMTAPAEIGK